MCTECASHQLQSWRDAEQRGACMYGDFSRDGMALEWHDVVARQPLDWGSSFRPQSVAFCFNAEGRGAIGARAKSDYGPGTSGFYTLFDGPLPASRCGEQRHQFLSLEFARPKLQAQLAECEGELEQQLRRAVFGTRSNNSVSIPRPMSPEQRSIVGSLLQPPVAKTAQSVWYQAKALELIAHSLFEPKEPELFCMRQKRVARDRVERTKELLMRDLANPPSLDSLGQEVGCSPFYLSRSFSREAGLTIPQYLRNARMERAAELLRSGKYNVTEAATEVGYASLSHFSKAFCETIGCCPVLYPMAKHVVLDR